MAGEEPSVIPVIIFLIAFGVFCAAMYGLGTEEENTSKYQYGAYNLAAVAAGSSAAVMILVWITKYGTAIGAWKKDDLFSALTANK
jgi:hypothetical protein